MTTMTKEPALGGETRTIRVRSSTMTMSGEQFWKTVVAGLIATFVMTMTGFWQTGLGLAAIDVGAMITGSMTAVHPDAPYTFVAGNLVHFANGIVLALLWWRFSKSAFPGIGSFRVWSMPSSHNSVPGWSWPRSHLVQVCFSRTLRLRVA